ncbi:hypothetical protein R5H30_03600 [Sulfitobacter sp. D35]|uniref:hypothetical protein n=1 Tax=Sulfitobacter sp. D35 TaxID=3083252 RepID=UPI00296E33DE|nr:hypothetical protein [Sulfitobacter sp. D35]MDW4497054.1 hypothetical protein [Sulfitobacter sp. D35]
MDILTKIGTGGVIGLIFGLALVAWVQPATVAGQALLVVVCTAAGIVLSGVVAALARLLARRGKDG